MQGIKRSKTIATTFQSEKMKFKNLLALTLSTAFLAACGGGGGGENGGGTPTALSATQTNFEAAAIKDSYVSFDWYLPTANVAPTSGTNFFYAVNVSTSASPLTGPQNAIDTVSTLSTTLALPTLANQNVYRVLKSGVIYATNLPSKGAFSYAGNDVVSTVYATDGLTKLYSSVYDSWSAPIALSGQISSTPIIKSFWGFTRLTTPVNFDFTKDWLAGSSYYTRKSYRQADTLGVYDWAGRTYGANVTAYAGAETTIENFFNSAANLAAGGTTSDSVVYAISDGAIKSVEGVRAWVATNKRPTSAAATDEYLTLFELNGKIYWGGFQKAGTRFQSIDGVDKTIVNDYSIRLNSTAGVSIKQAVKF